MKPPRRLTTLAILALLGFGVMLFQTFQFFETRYGLAGFRSLCSFNFLGLPFDCQAVETSSYAELFPGYALAGFGAAWFLAIFIIALMARSISWRREALRAELAFCTVGLACSAFYLFIMIAVLKIFCLLCMVVDIINIISFGVIFSLKPERIHKLKSDTGKWKVFAGFAGGALLMGFVFSAMFRSEGPSSQEIKETLDAVINSPVLSLRDDPSSPSIGPKQAPITIVKFSDFQCPGCRRGAESLHPVLARFRKEIRFVFRNYPLDSSCNRNINHPMHPASCEAARIAWCAHKQGHFQEVYETLFERQAEIVPGHVLDLLPKKDLDMTQLEACVNSTDPIQAISQDVEEGILLKIESTPTFFVNGHKLEGALPPFVWTKLIQQLLIASPAKIQ